MLPQHSKRSCEWGSPEPIVSFARMVLGGIDFDPCSSAYWNQHTVQATEFCSADGEKVPWPSKSRVFCNNPGMPKEFWRRCIAHDGPVFWVGFNLEQLAYLQDEHALDDRYVRCIPRSRVAYLQKPEDAYERAQAAFEEHLKKGGPYEARFSQRLKELEPKLGGPPIPGPSPTHSSYLLLMPTVPQQVDRFIDGAAMLGAVAW